MKGTPYTRPFALTSGRSRSRGESCAYDGSFAMSSGAASPVRAIVAATSLEGEITAYFDALPAQLGNELVARAHVGRRHLAVMRFLELMNKGRIGVAFPNQQAQRRFLFLAGHQA